MYNTNIKIYSSDLFKLELTNSSKSIIFVGTKVSKYVNGKFVTNLTFEPITNLFTIVTLLNIDFNHPSSYAVPINDNDPRDLMSKIVSFDTFMNNIGFYINYSEPVSVDFENNKKMLKIVSDRKEINSIINDHLESQYRHLISNNNDQGIKILIRSYCESVYFDLDLFKKLINLRLDVLNNNIIDNMRVYGYPENLDREITSSQFLHKFNVNISNKTAIKEIIKKVILLSPNYGSKASINEMIDTSKLIKSESKSAMYLALSYGIPTVHEFISLNFRDKNVFINYVFNLIYMCNNLVENDIKVPKIIANYICKSLDIIDESNYSAEFLIKDQMQGLFSSFVLKSKEFKFIYEPKNIDNILYDRINKFFIKKIGELNLRNEEIVTTDLYKILNAESDSELSKLRLQWFTENIFKNKDIFNKTKFKTEYQDIFKMQMNNECVNNYLLKLLIKINNLNGDDNNE